MNMNLDLAISMATGALMPHFDQSPCGSGCCMDTWVSMQPVSIADAATASAAALAQGARIRVRKDRVTVTSPSRRGWGGFIAQAPTAVFLLPR